MVSTWWLVVAFLGGEFIGILLMALMSMADGLPERAQHAPAA